MLFVAWGPGVFSSSVSFSSSSSRVAAGPCSLVRACSLEGEGGGGGGGEEEWLV